MTQIDELVKDARTMAIAMDKTFKDSNAANTWRAVANALEAQAAREALLREDLQHMETLAEEYLASSNAQAAELTRLRERNAELEKERDEALMNLTNEQCHKSDDVFDAYSDLASANKHIATLEAQLKAFRKAARGISKAPSEHREYGTVFIITEYRFDALMSALRNAEGEKDGE